ncbi:MAG: hypothetical protein KatS3mg033_2250 [Thermonema sp.]|uniref:hypothetical protein n=1 Tax=Thermonema sp. TaxID=2231181 RepID=UPI0021DD079D|nr:hypothetical protein [Thermonema sp.]GIV40450.1 MAG: hypothetical protein KatS3mg033_2250 [Thermonema sp.]
MNRVQKGGYTQWQSRLMALFLTVACVTSGWAQATFRWTGAAGTAWNNPANWVQIGPDADGIPDANDDVVFDGGNNCTLTADAECNDLTIPITYTGTFSLASFSLSVYGDWNHATPLNAFQSATGTVVLKGSSLPLYTMYIDSLMAIISII